MTPKWLKPAIKFTIFLSFGLLLIWYSIRNFSASDLQNLGSIVRGADKLTILTCVMILLVSHFLRALRWRIMITPLGKNPGLNNVFYAVLTGFFFNLLFPRLGELMKCTLLGKYEKISVDKLVGTMVAERLIDFLCLIFIILLTILTQTSLVGNYTIELTTALSAKLKSAILPIAVSFILISVLLFLLFKYLKNSNLQLVIKTKILVSGIKQGLLTILQMDKKGMFLLYTLSIWFLYLASIRVGFPAITALAHLGWVPSLTVLTFGSFAMIATQGGIGAYQLAVQKTLGLYGVNAITGYAFGWLLWSVQTVLMLVTGPLALFLLYFNNKKAA